MKHLPKGKEDTFFFGDWPTMVLVALGDQAERKLKASIILTGAAEEFMEQNKRVYGAKLESSGQTVQNIPPLKIYLQSVVKTIDTPLGLLSK